MALDDTETRVVMLEKAAGTTITGYAALFNSEAVISGEFRERIAPGAFSMSLRTNDVLALMHHDSSRVLGRMSSGTLRLREDAKGLWFELDADPTTPDGQAALGLTRRQDIKGCSFGFRVRHDDWLDTDDLPLRTLMDVDLIEVTLTATPAYEATTAALRSLEQYRASEFVRRKMELDLRMRGIKFN